ncbi:MAG: hypothetical protein EOP24_47895 [Hyphomicrobiales bacterium]|nr:MAG: hypothetical protein EOP24_47895 [Hyphomicrobiales bacterium]
MTVGAARVNRMVAFEVRWCALGGGPAETIMADFGMDAAAFFRHLAEYLELSPPTPLRPDLLERMKAVARRRLWLAT